jgi:hypothetical protein
LIVALGYTPWRPARPSRRAPRGCVRCSTGERPDRRPVGALPEGELATLISRLVEAGVALPPTSLRS